MRNLLVINSSPNVIDSSSRKLVDQFVKSWFSRFPKYQVIYRDVAVETIPHLIHGTLEAISSSETVSEAALKTRELSDQLISEIMKSDTIIFGVPMHNFGIPSALKAYFDHVARSGVTFDYLDDKMIDFFKNKRAIVITTGGGGYVDTPEDFQGPYIKYFLNFIGIENITFIRAHRLLISEESYQLSMKTASDAIQNYVKEISDPIPFIDICLGQRFDSMNAEAWEICSLDSARMMDDVQGHSRRLLSQVSLPICDKSLAAKPLYYVNDISTQKPISVYGIFKQENEIGRIQFSGKPTFCVNEGDKIDELNTLDHQMNEDANPISAVSRSSENTIERPFSSAKIGFMQGVLTGLGNVIGNTLIRNGYSKQHVQIINKCFLYTSIFCLALYQSHQKLYTQSERINTHNLGQIFPEAVFNTGLFAVTTATLSGITLLCNWFGDKLESVGWKKTKVAFKCVGNYAGYVGYGYRFFYQSPLETLTTMASGIVGQKMTEGIGENAMILFSSRQKLKPAHDDFCELCPKSKLAIA